MDKEANIELRHDKNRKPFMEENGRRIDEEIVKEVIAETEEREKHNEISRNWIKNANKRVYG